jgi:hypothetical protein
MNLLRYPPLRYVITLVALGLVVDWLRLPALLSQEQADPASFRASYSTKKGGRIMLQAVDGKTIAISCRKAPALCTQAKQLISQKVVVEVVQPSFWQGRWVRKASVAGKVIEAEADQQKLFEDSKTIQTVLTAFFVAFMALLWAVRFAAARKPAS